jgi:hypothetical protein
VEAALMITLLPELGLFLITVDLLPLPQDTSLIRILLLQLLLLQLMSLSNVVLASALPFLPQEMPLFQTTAIPAHMKLPMMSILNPCALMELDQLQELSLEPMFAEITQVQLNISPLKILQSHPSPHQAAAFSHPMEPFTAIQPQI